MRGQGETEQGIVAERADGAKLRVAKAAGSERSLVAPSREYQFPSSDPPQGA